MAGNGPSNDPKFSELSASTVDQLLSRINELSNALSSPVETEVRRIFRGENVPQQSESHVRPTISSESSPTTSQSSARAASSRFSDSRRYFVARRQFEGQRSSFTRRRQTRPKVTDNRPFLRDLVLLSGPDDVIVPRQGARLALMENGHVVSGCRFTKGMNAAQVEIAIVEAFDGKIPADVDIELMVSMHTSLVIPSLAPGQQGIDGAILQRLYQNKPVYVRPSRKLVQLQKTSSQQVCFCLLVQD